MRKTLFILLLFLLPWNARAAFSNYSSVLIGERAAGMGGAYTALIGDAAANPYYNPAALARSLGSSLSASASIYNKFDTEVGTLGDFYQAPQRLNRGFFRALPASSGSILLFDSFAVGLSIVIPDYDTFAGEIKSTDQVNSFLSYVDESLWVGGSFALNISPRDSIGITTYYTARNLIRSNTDRLVTGAGAATITTEEKQLTNNSLVYILGYYRQLTPQVSLGASFRFPSLEISGQGAYYTSVTTTSPYSYSQSSHADLKSETRIPPKLSLGIAHTRPRFRTYSFDVNIYGTEAYEDVSWGQAMENVDHKIVANFAVGAEFVIEPWLKWRIGGFTNFSSHKKPQDNATLRGGDHIDMLGWSTNVAFSNKDNVTFTFGGYYTGGRGETVQRVGDQLMVIPKTQQIFSMLIGTSYIF